MSQQRITGGLTTVIFLAALVLAFGRPARANLLSNPSFEEVGPDGVGTTFTGGVGGAGNSSAKDWTVFQNTAGTTATDLETSTLAGGGSFMIRVVTDGPQNGLVQVFGPASTGPDQVIGSAWVFVNSGQVRLGTGNGGNTGADVLSTTTGQWELLQAPNGVAPVNTIAIYSSLAGPADFFVDLASVEIVPEPSSLAMLSLGALAAVVISGRASRRVAS